MGFPRSFFMSPSKAAATQVPRDVAVSVCLGKPKDRN